MKQNIDSTINPIEVADDVIMQLYLMRNKEAFSKATLQTGIDLFDYLLTLPEKGINYFEIKNVFRTSPNFDKAAATEELRVGEQSSNLQTGKQMMLKLLADPNQFETESVEKLQELILKISMPIWRGKINFLKEREKETERSNK